MADDKTLTPKQRRAKEQKQKSGAASKEYIQLKREEFKLQDKIEKSLKEEHRVYLDLYDKKTQDLLRNAESLKLQDAALKKAEELLQTQLALDDPNQKQVAHLEKMIKAYSEAVEALKDQKAEADAVTKSIKEIQGAAQHFAGTLFGINERSRQIGKHFLDANGNVKLFNGTLTSTFQHLKKSVDKAGILGSTLEKVYKSVGKVHEKVKNYGKSLMTGPLAAAEQYATDVRLTAQDVGYDLNQMNREIVQRSAEVTKGYNITESEARKTYVTMLRGATQFTNVSREQSISMQRNATLMERQGVSAETSAKIWNELQITFGKSAKESERLTLQAGNLARKLKMDTNVVAQQFLNSMDQLAIYALPRAEKEFAKLMAIQKQTGVETNKLMSAMDQWTTFEGAAEAAGTLNAALGLNISSMEMMDTTLTKGPAEALILLKRRFDEAGVSVDNLSPAMAKVVAKSIGSGSVSEAMKLLQTDTGKLRSAMEKAGGVHATLEELQGELNKKVEEGSTLEQDKAKAQDESRKKLQKYVDTWYKFQQGVQKWMASHPWLTMIGGMVMATGVGIAKLIFLWRSWGMSATAEAARVSAATARATGTLGGGGYGRGGRGGGSRSLGRMQGGRFISPKGGGGGMFSKGGMARGIGGGLLMAGAGMGLGYLRDEHIGTPESNLGHAGSTLARGGEYAMYGGAMLGAPGAIIGGGIGLAQGGIEWMTDKYAPLQDPKAQSGVMSAHSKDFRSDVYNFDDGGFLGTDVGMVDLATGAPYATAKKGEKITPAGKGTSTTLNLHVDLVMGDGTVIKGEKRTIELLADGMTKAVMEKLNIAS